MALPGGEPEQRSHKYKLVMSFSAHRNDQFNSVWLNGGPGCSSLTGLSKENGPLHFRGNSSTPRPNSYAWTKLANVLYVDQPVGTGYSTGGSPPRNNSEVTGQFHQWLQKFYQEFPGLKSKNTFLAGESYAAIYVSLICLLALIIGLDKCKLTAASANGGLDSLFHPSNSRK